MNINIREIVKYICFALVLSLIRFSVAAEDFANALRAYLKPRVEVEKRDPGIVVGIVGEHSGAVRGANQSLLSFGRATPRCAENGQNPQQWIHFNPL